MKKIIKIVLSYFALWLLCFFLSNLLTVLGLRENTAQKDIQNIWYVIIFVLSLLVAVPRKSFFRSFKVIWVVWLSIMVIGSIFSKNTYFVIIELVLQGFLLIESIFMFSSACRCKSCNYIVIADIICEKAYCPHCGQQLNEQQ